MADVVTFKIEGLKQLGDRMRKLSADMALKTARSATSAGAGVIKKLAVQNIISSPSVDTGDLKANVIIKRLPKSQTPLTSEHIVTVRGRGKKNSKAIKAGKRGAPHAHFVEFGTVNMPAEPFLRPAFDQGKSRAVEAMIKRLKDRLAKAGV